MASLPTGTLTILFTDIEGSTALLQRLGEAYRQVLADHDRLLRAAFARAGGHEVRTQGDAFFVVFERARDAIAGAVNAQRAVMAHAWSHGETLRIRMGLHTGEPEVAGADYMGLDVHRAARISQVAWGGQILISRTTADLVERDLPEGVTLRDLGRHRLKDLERAEHLYQVLHADLPTEFPPLRSLDVSPNNLPRKLSSFIGREREITEVKRLLSTTHLLTLVGTGGAGKTRLALQVAGEVLEAFPHGVWLVELGTVTDPALVTQAVASVLGVREEPGRSLEQILAGYLKSRQLLLMLDNCEHVVSAVAALAERLLENAPRLQILCTSREALGITGETAFRVPSLSVPDARRLPPLETLEQSEAVRLFVARAAAVVPGFALTERNAAPIVQICQRLDGIPLAIELAASRAKVLSVEQIASRLDDRFRFLAGGSRTALPRHQTLRAAMDWSYDLLTAQERAVLRRLSVFNGGCSLTAAESVCANGDVERHEVLDLLTRLVDKSLVLVEQRAGAVRYVMLETVRQYSRGKLLDAGESSTIRTRHLIWAIGLTEYAGAQLFGADQLAWLNRLDLERDNVRSALEWAIGERSGAEALRLTAALWWYWVLRSRITEGREWVEKTLEIAPEPGAARARALVGAGLFAAFSGDIGGSTRLAEDALAMARQHDDRLPIGSALLLLAMSASYRGDHAQSMDRASEALEIFQALGRPWETAVTRTMLGEFAFHGGGDSEMAAAALEQSLSEFTAMGERWGMAFALRWLGLLARYRGDYKQAAALQERSLALNRELGHPWGVATSLMTQALVPLRQGEYGRAEALLEESLAMLQEGADRASYAGALYYLGLTWFYRSDRPRATAYLEDSLSQFRELGIPDGTAQALTSLGRLALQQNDAERAQALGEESLATLQESGSLWSRAYALRLLAAVALHRGDHARATTLAGESLGLCRELGDVWAMAWVLGLLGEIALSHGDMAEAQTKFAESLRLRRASGDRLGIAECLEGFARVEATQGGPDDRLARLLSAADAIRRAIGALPPATDARVLDALVAGLRARMPADAFEAAWAAGRAMPPESAAAYALGAAGAALPASAAGA
jgi:predicted ATPase/class 3 adenylate cyclase